MFIDLNDLALRGGERHQRVYSLDVAPVVLGGAGYQVLVPDGVKVAVNRVAGGFLLDVSLDARVYGPCARCLQEAVLEVHAEQQEFAATAKGGWEGTELSEFIEELVADISAITREALVLALPAQIVCAPECKGLCPRCGHDLNVGCCACGPEGIDERWGVLKDLRLGDDVAP
ncbi:MAG: hypothetical protein A2133_12125 [Actinobacteria bacterium RBG_16_64_13]|nr:MAG: hypothetical protein A2133_12125 [Actinobacteria bacterium RBG_16_64_13]